MFIATQIDHLVKRQGAFLLLFLTIGAVAACKRPTQQSAGEFFVAPNGSDAHSCDQARGVDTPKQTLNSAVACLSAGSTLWVKAGTYPEVLHWNIPSGTSWENKVRIAAYGTTSTCTRGCADVVWVKPASSTYAVIAFAGSSNGGSTGEQQYIELDGINVDSSATNYDDIKIEAGYGYNAHHIRIQNAELIGTKNVPSGFLDGAMNIITTATDPSNLGFNEFRNLEMHHTGNKGTYGYAIYLQSSDTVIENCLMYDVAGTAISVYNGYLGHAGSSRNRIINNVFRGPVIALDYDPRVDVIIVGRGQGNAIANNLITDVYETAQTWGIQVFSALDTTLANNTIANTSGEGILIEIYSERAVLRNNISYNHTVANYVDRGVATSISNNLFNGDPQFASPSTGNFTLLSTSPAIDAGMTIAAITTDLVGVPRPQHANYDIGAYEYQAAGPTPPSTDVTLTVTPPPLSLVTVAWSAIPDATATDWLGLFTPGAASSSYLGWQYVNCTTAATVPVPAGKCELPLTGLAAGSYEVRLFAADTDRTLATTTFTTNTAAVAAKSRSRR